MLLNEVNVVFFLSLYICLCHVCVCAHFLGCLCIPLSMWTQILRISSAKDKIHDLKKLNLRGIIMSTSKLLKGPLTSVCEFTKISWNGVSPVERQCWNQRHGSIIHSYYKNTASKDTYQIIISEGCAFSTSSQISQTQIHREREYARNTHTCEL